MLVLTGYSKLRAVVRNNKTMKYLNRLWKDIKQGENIDLYLTIIAGIVLAFLNIFGITSSSWLSSLTLAILALLAYAMLGNRHQIDELTQSAETIFQREWPENNKQNDIKNSKDLLMIGVSLKRTIKDSYTLFEEKLRQGCAIRVLLTYPDGPALRMVASRTYYNVDVGRTRKGVHDTLEKLHYLKQTTSGDLQIRTINYPASIGGFFIDTTTSHGILYLEHYTYKVPDEDMPKIVLRRKDGYWYDYFSQQVEVLWNNGIDWQYVEPKSKHQVMKKNKLSSSSKAADRSRK